MVSHGTFVAETAKVTMSEASVILPNIPLDVKEGLRWAESVLTASEIESARLEAQLLLAHALGVSRVYLLAGIHPEPTYSQWQDFERLVSQRSQHVPSAYLRGEQEFYGLAFHVSPAVLIPRPETELLVEFLLQQKPGLFADVGTGSGCIAISSLVHCWEAWAVAIDLSEAALKVARSNAARHGVLERMGLVQGSLLESVQEYQFDGIVANPPYISTSEIPTLQTEVREYEPRMALDGGEDGLAIHRKLVMGAGRVLKSGGWLAVEVAMGQAEAVATLMEANGFQKVALQSDLAGIARLVSGWKCGDRPKKVVKEEVSVWT